MDYNNNWINKKNETLEALFEKEYFYILIGTFFCTIAGYTLGPLPKSLEKIIQMLLFQIVIGLFGLKLLPEVQLS